MDLISFFRQCGWCGALWRSEAYFCRSCWRLLFQQQKNLTRAPNYSFRTKTLFHWVPESSPLLRTLLHGLKRGGCEKAFAILALEFLSRLEWDGLGRNRILVPAPPRRKGEKDHAFKWGQALAFLCGLKMESPLCRMPHSGAQKNQTLYGRRQIQLQMGEPWNVDKPVIFVDDVITSGSTAMAAFEALGRPKNYEVWTICHRPRLAPDPQLLL